MSTALVLELIQQAVAVCLLTAAPLLMTALIIGVLVSFAQAITQVQEMTLTFVPKFVALALVGLLAVPWMISQLVGFILQMVQSLPLLAAS